MVSGSGVLGGAGVGGGGRNRCCCRGCRVTSEGVPAKKPAGSRHGFRPALQRGLTGDWLDPPAPLCLRHVAGRFPQFLPQLVILKDHRVNAHHARDLSLAAPASSSARAMPRRRNGWMDRQPVQVRAPSVPARDERPDDAVPLPRDEACSGVALKQGEYRPARIAGQAPRSRQRPPTAQAARERRRGSRCQGRCLQAATGVRSPGRV